MPASPTMQRFEHACRLLADALADDGYRYLKSKREILRTEAEWTQTLAFQTSTYNTSGSVTLWAWFRIDNDRVRLWRRQHDALTGQARIFNCQLGYLGVPARAVRWDVAGDPSSAVSDVVRLTRSEGSRIVRLVQDVPEFVARTTDADLTFFDPADVVDLLAAHKQSDRIADYLRRLAGGFQSTGQPRKNGQRMLAASLDHVERGSTENYTASRLVAALRRADRVDLLRHLPPASESFS